MALKWYVVHAYSNFENKVKTSIEERVKLHGLEEKFGEIKTPDQGFEPNVERMGFVRD